MGIDEGRKRRPIIGVTGPDEGGWPAWIMTSLALKRAGARARRITPRSHSLITSIEGLDGLVVGGGADINPALYGESKVIRQIRRESRRWRFRMSPAKAIWRFSTLIGVWLLRKAFSTSFRQADDQSRDLLESKLLREACERGLPVLGICRGMQLMNVQFGGTLHQDINSYYEETPQLVTVLPRKTIEIKRGTRLYSILGRPRAQVNSLHHQSVNKLGEGLEVVAREPNGIVQAIEHRDHDFWLGVQWHPEYLPQDHAQRHIFERLVRAAKLHVYLRGGLRPPDDLTGPYDPPGHPSSERPLSG